MSIFKIDLASRYQNAFGFLAKNFSSRVLGVGLSNTGLYAKIDTYQIDEYDFDEIILSTENIQLKFGSMPFISNGNHGILQGAWDLLDHKKEDYNNVFAPPPMLQFSRKKNIKETFVDGSDGVVVENYGMQPWSIKLQGILIDIDTHNYPKNKVKDLIKLFNVSDRIDVVGDLFADKGINSIYFTSINIEGVEGFPDTIKYTLEAKSINPIEFELN